MLVQPSLGRPMRRMWKGMVFLFLIFSAHNWVQAISNWTESASLSFKCVEHWILTLFIYSYQIWIDAVFVNTVITNSKSACIDQAIYDRSRYWDVYRKSVNYASLLPYSIVLPPMTPCSKISKPIFVFVILAGIVSRTAIRSIVIAICKVSSIATMECIN